MELDDLNEDSMQVMKNNIAYILYNEFDYFIDVTKITITPLNRSIWDE